MRRQLSLSLPAAVAQDPLRLHHAIAAAAAVDLKELQGFHTLSRSIDARSRTIRTNLTVLAFIGEPFEVRRRPSFHFQDVRKARHCVAIIGAGPAGLFAALRCLELGVRPIVLDRGKDVQSRRRDLALLCREGILNPDSNYCLGEGGAGTYSDGKLYTRSSKRGDIEKILQLFVYFGADPEILVEAHPHIGTNKLPMIIAAMRQQILDAGGEVHFGQRLVGISTAHGKICSLQTHDDSLQADAYVLATGHSARDIFEMLPAAGIAIEAKPLAIGVRIEHPQTLIDEMQYHCPKGLARPAFLPPASYRVVESIGKRGVFSFCMCPGGIIAPASTSDGALVVNGWSPSARNNRYANSGMVVEVHLEDAAAWLHAHPREGSQGPLQMMDFQAGLERKAFVAGGGAFTAPAARLTDFVSGKVSADLPDCSYPRGIRPADLEEVFPPFIMQSLREGLRAFDRKRRGYLTREAVVVATESRTSSPVRIPRIPETLQHPDYQNLYPCGEGAGYAGGIVSAAMDGQRVTEALVAKWD